MMKSLCFPQCSPCADVFTGCGFHFHFPSEVMLEQYTQEVLKITEHFDTEIGAICFEATSEKYPKGCSTDVGILANEKCQSLNHRWLVWLLNVRAIDAPGGT